MDLSISPGPGGKAAVAGTRAKRAFLLACMLLAAGLYASQEHGRKAGAARLQPARPGVQEVAARFALQDGDPAVVTVRNHFYDSKDRVHCGEVGARTGSGAEVKFRDGVRIFVCGSDLHD